MISKIVSHVRLHYLNIVQTDAASFKRARETAVKAFRTQQFARTNQFEVHKTLDGLIEKFQILYRQDLAEALDGRLKELQSLSTKWTPEILALLLDLSDRPLEKTDLDDLDKLKAPPPPPQLTWKEIFQEDLLNGDRIWDDIDYAAHGSSDDDSVYAGQEHGIDDDTSATSVVEEDLAQVAQTLIIVPDESRAELIRNAQGPLKSLSLPPKDQPGEDENLKITELMAIRETLFMLRGLPTTMFDLDQNTGAVQLRRAFALAQASSLSTSAILQDLAALGSSPNALRTWTRMPQRIALLQSFQDSVCRSMHAFDSVLSKMERRYIRATDNAVISISGVYAEVQRLSESLLHLKDLVVELSDFSPPFQCLELLYDRMCLAQLTEDSLTFEEVGKIFFTCLHTYLRPMRMWMEEGNLDKTDRVFLIQENEQSHDASLLWHDRFSLRLDQSGKLYAPRFLHPAYKRILNTGKTIVFQKALGLGDGRRLAATVPEPPLDFESVCKSCTNSLSLPFAETFANAFDEWVKSKHMTASVTVKERLFGECKLSEALDALEFLYLSKNGTLLQNFGDAIFEKLDSRLRSWDDRFLLTDLAQGVFGQVPLIDVENIGIRVATNKASARSMKRLESLLVDYPVSLQLWSER